MKKAGRLKLQGKQAYIEREREKNPRLERESKQNRTEETRRLGGGD